MDAVVDAQENENQQGGLVLDLFGIDHAGQLGLVEGGAQVAGPAVRGGVGQPHAFEHARVIAGRIEPFPVRSMASGVLPPE